MYGKAFVIISLGLLGLFLGGIAGYQVERLLAALMDSDGLLGFPLGPGLGGALVGLVVGGVIGAWLGARLRDPEA